MGGHLLLEPLTWADATSKHCFELKEMEHLNDIENSKIENKQLFGSCKSYHLALLKTRGREYVPSLMTIIRSSHTRSSSLPSHTGLSLGSRGCADNLDVETTRKFWQKEKLLAPVLALFYLFIIILGFPHLGTRFSMISGGGQCGLHKVIIFNITIKYPLGKLNKRAMFAIC